MGLLLKKVRLSYPDLWVPRPFKPGDTPKFKAVFLVPKKDKEQIKAISDEIRSAAKKAWGAEDYEEVLEDIKNNRNKFCYHDGDKKKSSPELAGLMTLSAGSKTRVAIRDRDGKTPLSQDDGKLYAGCYVNAFIEFFTYENSGKGMSCGLGPLQFVKDGEAFGGGTRFNPDDLPDLSAEEDEDEEALV